MRMSASHVELHDGFVRIADYRMLHGRTAFRGARWVRGVYFDRGHGDRDRSEFARSG
jgi:hypothetical protein